MAWAPSVPNAPVFSLPKQQPLLVCSLRSTWWETGQCHSETGQTAHQEERGALKTSLVTTDGLRKLETFAGSRYCGFQVHKHQNERVGAREMVR